MIKQIELDILWQYLKKENKNYLFCLDTIKDNSSEKFGVFKENILLGVILKNHGVFNLIFSTDNIDFDELNIFLNLNFANEIISDTRLNLGKEKICNILIKRCYSTEKSLYNYPFENNMDNIKKQYGLLKECDFPVPTFEEFYLSLFYKNKDKSLRLYGIFENNTCVCSAIINYIDDNFAKLSSVSTSICYRRQGHAQKLLNDILNDEELNGKEIYLLCENETALRLYKKIGFSVNNNLFVYNFNS